MSKFHFNSLDDANFKTKTKVVNGPITWGWDIEWCVKGSDKEKYRSNVGQMPFDVWGRNRHRGDILQQQFGASQVLSGSIDSVQVTEYVGIIVCIVPEVEFGLRNVKEEGFILDLAYGPKLHRKYPIVQGNGGVHLVTGEEFLTAQAEYQQLLWK